MGNTTSEQNKNSPNTNIELISLFVNSLKEWSNKDTITLLFDSDIDGYCREYFAHVVLNKRNLYFINYDDNENVFGGYLNAEITQPDTWIQDPNSFVFSLIRQGEFKNKRYFIQEIFQTKAFRLLLNNSLGFFTFGDIDFNLNISRNAQLTHLRHHEKGKEKFPLCETPKWYPQKRVIVLEMS
ncbi:TLDc domain-containing protein [Entamoeba marina]